MEVATEELDKRETSNKMRGLQVKFQLVHDCYVKYIYIYTFLKNIK